MLHGAAAAANPIPSHQQKYKLLRLVSEFWTLVVCARVGLFVFLSLRVAAALSYDGEPLMTLHEKSIKIWLCRREYDSSMCCCYKSSSGSSPFSTSWWVENGSRKESTAAHMLGNKGSLKAAKWKPMIVINGCHPDGSTQQGLKCAEGKLQRGKPQSLFRKWHFP